MSVTDDPRPRRSRWGLDGHDRRRLGAAVRAVSNARQLRRVQAVLVCKDGAIHAGENICMTPQQVCPRAEGEGYEKCKSVCGQLHHAEVQALAMAGDNARGGIMCVNYHYCCDACMRLMADAGVTVMVLA